jgi:hypothetical protein
MRKLLVVLALALIGCMPDLTGIEDLDDYAGDVASQLEVASVTCPEVLAIGDSVRCTAHNASGTLLEGDGVTVVIWTSSDPSIASVDLGGIVRGLSAGSTTIQAAGTKESSAQASITIQ